MIKSKDLRIGDLVYVNHSHIKAETLGYYQEVLKLFKDFKERKGEVI